METFNVTGVMELGMGWNSTIVFNELAEYVVSVETDKQWINELKVQGIVETENHKIIHHQTPHGIVRQTRRWNLSPSVLQQLDQEAVTLWKSLLNDRLNMLFIDCISSLRYPALVELHSDFDIIVMHDYELKRGHGRELHWANGTFECPDTHVMFIDETYRVETAFMIRKNLITDKKIESLRSAHAVAVKDWAPQQAKFRIF
jgi:hypothetical protein